MQSKMLAGMLEGIEGLAAAAGGGEDSALTIDTLQTIPLPDIAPAVLQLVCQYLVEKRSCKNNSMSEFKELQSLDPSKEEDKQLVLDLLLAADYLDC